MHEACICALRKITFSYTCFVPNKFLAPLSGIVFLLIEIQNSLTILWIQLVFFIFPFYFILDFFFVFLFFLFL